MSLAMSPADSSLLALTGWTSVVSNSAPERVYVSADAGAHFVDVTRSLRNATGTIGQWRPSVLLLLPLLLVTRILLMLLARPWLLDLEERALLPYGRAHHGPPAD